MRICKRDIRIWARAFAGDVQGATAIEYGLIAALIAIAAITAMKGLGGQLRSTFNTTSSAVSMANASAH